jgi:hypothetical protein
MSGRIQHGRIGKSQSPRKKARSPQKQFPQRREPYFYTPTPENRHTRPYNKTPYVFNFSQAWQGKRIHEMVYWPHRPRGLPFLADYVLGGKFDLAARPDLVMEFRSLHTEYYGADHEVLAIALKKRGFKRHVYKGSMYPLARYSIRSNSKPAQVYLSCDKTPFDEFIEVVGSHRPAWDFSHEKPLVTFAAAPFEESLVRHANEAERKRWNMYPIPVAFYGTPVRLERLFMDNENKQATYLSIQPFGFYGNSPDHYYCLVVQIDEEGKTSGWPESLLGLPFHFSGALCSTYNEDLVEARFERVEEAEIENGLRFEMLGVVETVDEGKVSVKPDWSESQLADDGNREVMELSLQEGIEEPVVGESCRFRGIIPIPREVWEKPAFKWREDKLPDAMWKACALEPGENLPLRMLERRITSAG